MHFPGFLTLFVAILALIPDSEANAVNYGVKSEFFCNFRRFGSRTSSKELFCAELAIHQTPRAIAECPRGWLQYDETCYFRQPDLMGYEEAKASCERRNAEMFGINDHFEIDAVRKLFPDYYFTWVQADVEEEL